MPEFDPVGTIAFFRERQRLESATTAKVLRSMSPDMLSFRAHPQSSSIGVIAWTIVRCLRICNHLTHSATAEISRDDPPEYDVLLSTFNEETRNLNASLIRMTQRDWEAERTVTSGSRILLQQPLGQIFWLFHADAIHHRGQVSVFLRPFGAKVPSIYGPSGDCPPLMQANATKE